MPLIATESLLNLAFRFTQQESESPTLSPERLKPFVAEQVGYEIVPRQVTFGVLSAFCGVLAVAGIWLRWKRKVGILMWASPAIAILAAGVLVMLGARSRQAVPTTVSMAQLVTMERGVEDAHATGLMAMYNQQGHDGPIGARDGGIFRPDMSGLDQQTRRMVWTDSNAWHWENLSLPAGMRTAPFERAVTIDGLVDARGAFGPDGLEGTLRAGPLEGVSDAVIALPWGRNLAVELTGDGRFTAGRGQVLAPGQFLAGRLLDDEQRRRQSVYQQLLKGAAGKDAVDRPLMLFWADPLDMQFILPRDARRFGSALVIVPFEFERTPPGTPLAIPSPFLDFQCVRGLDRQLSAAYSNHRREWIECNGPTRLWLRFQVPEAVLPLTLDRANLTVKIDAPDWKVDVCVLAGREIMPVDSSTGPVGPLAFEVDEPESLQLDDKGGIVIGILVGEELRAKQPIVVGDDQRSPWRISDVQLDVAGTTRSADS
jgi:hypothetical protein